MNNKLSDKDKRDWKNFISSKEKIANKDFEIEKKVTKDKKIIDLHGYSLKKANIAIEDFINNCFIEGIKKITVITGKGTRSKTENDPYLSKDLSILKYSVPEFIKSNLNLMKKIKKIDEASIDDKKSGVFYIYLKTILKNKFR